MPFNDTEYMGININHNDKRTEEKTAKHESKFSVEEEPVWKSDFVNPCESLRLVRGILVEKCSRICAASFRAESLILHQPKI